MTQRILKIRGGNKLVGNVKISGAKNSAGHLLAASILTKENCIIHNVPDIVDTTITINILVDCGVQVKRLDRHSYLINASSINKTIVNNSLAKDSRAPAIFLGAIASRCGEAAIPQPGGDKIGKRPLDRHLNALEKLGYKTSFDGSHYYLKADNLHPAEIAFGKSTHMGTDNVLFASCLIPGVTTIVNAAEEPEVDDMIEYLNSMGAKIKRIKHRKIKVEGVKELHGTEYTAMPDRNEAVTYAVAALITGGNIFLEGIKTNQIMAFLKNIKLMGAKYKVDANGVLIESPAKLKSVNMVTGAHPGFMTDWQPQITTLMTQSVGTSNIIEKVHSNRFGYVNDLIKMGANIKLYNPQIDNPNTYYDFDLIEGDSSYHACQVIGPAKLNGITTAVLDIRAGAAIVLAGLCAEGETILTGLAPLERGYEDLILKLSALGADIRIYEQ
jgi:UDP-N-acetylglucosamine 1-carboxyvinyltransferase